MFKCSAKQSTKSFDKQKFSNQLKIDEFFEYMFEQMVRLADKMSWKFWIGQLLLDKNLIWWHTEYVIVIIGIRILL